MNTIQENYSLRPYNTFGIDVQADYFLSYNSEAALIKNLCQIQHLNSPIFNLGEGSNLLFINNYKGIILHSQIKGIDITEESEQSVKVRVGGGVIWDDFVAWAVEHNFSGTENLSTIPGTVGASPVQNIGAYGVEAKDIISCVESVELATGKKRTFSNADCLFAYRDSIFKHELKGKYVVTYVTYQLSKQPEFVLNYGKINTLLDGRPPSVQLIRDIITEVRNNKLPDHKTLGNAGSFFTNPYIRKSDYQKLQEKFPNIPHYPINDNEVKVPAGWLIDQCGLKGFEHKEAAVHKNQALVLINTGNATGKDILELAQIVITKVQEKFGITLSPEVNIIG